MVVSEAIGGTTMNPNTVNRTSMPSEISPTPAARLIPRRMSTWTTGSRTRVRKTATTRKVITELSRTRVWASSQATSTPAAPTKPTKNGPAPVSAPANRA